MLRISFLLAILASSHLAFAQTIGDDALRKVQEGRVSTLEGEFIVYLADTVSPDFVISRLESLGYELGFMDIQPFTIAIVNQPEEAIITELTSRSQILDFNFRPEPVDTSFFEDLLSSQDLEPDNYDASLARIIANQTSERLFIRFQYSMNEQAVIRFMTEFRAVAYEIISDFPRTTNILVEPGTEKDVMLEIEKLPFVEYTALIGVIEY